MRPVVKRAAIARLHAIRVKEIEEALNLRRREQLQPGFVYAPYIPLTMSPAIPMDLVTTEEQVRAANREFARRMNWRVLEPEVVRSRRTIKVYHAPGYPIDPAAEERRTPPFIISVLRMNEH